MASSNTSTSVNAVSSTASLANNNTLHFDSSDDTDCSLSLCSTQHLSLNEVNQFIGTNQDTFDFLHINSRSLSKNFDEINNTLLCIKKQFTVIAVTETWLKPVNEDLYQLPGYSFVSLSRPIKPGGGVGIFVNDQYHYKPLSDLSISNDIIECIFIEIVLVNRANILIGCIYRPPSSDINEFNYHISNLFSNKQFTNKNNICLLGDFNINLLLYETHLPTSNFINTLFSIGLLPSINCPTRVTSTSETLIDNIFTNFDFSNCKSARLFSDISDHFPILLQFSKSPNTNTKRSAPNSIERRIFNDSAMNNFRNYLLSLNWSFLNSNGDANVSYDRFINLFLAGFNKFFPKKAITSYRKTPRKGWMTTGLVKSCEQKSVLFKLSKTIKTEDSKLKYTIYRNKLNSLLRRAERDFYYDKIKLCNNDCRKSWKIINQLLNKNSHTASQSTEYNLNGKVLSDDNLIADNFNHYFVNIGKNLAEKIPESKKSFLKHMPANCSIKNSCALYLTTAPELITTVNNMKNSDSAGYDEISINLIKKCVDCIAEPLSLIFNLCLSEGSFPDSLKTAKVCPIFKSGSKMDFTNYRPISILASFSKILEKLVATRLLSFIDKHNILSQSQYGFRKNHSSYMALMTLFDKVSEAIDKNEYSVGIFIDLSKAFDTLDHNILLNKLNVYGFRGTANLIIKSYLSNRQQYVLYNNCQSSFKSISCGVPQGSILGPLLFLLYINDMASCSRLMHFILFADDTNMFYSNPDIWKLMHIVNLELDILADWFRANRLSLNINKTNFMMFGYKKVPGISESTPNEFYLTIDGERIKQVEFTKFLGVIIDQKFTWQRHISHVSLKVSKSLYALRQVKFKLPRESLLLLYYSLVHSHLNYCNIIWGNASSSTLRELLLLQKRAIRIVNKSSYLSHTAPIFKELLVLKLPDLNLYNTAQFVYKHRLNILPQVCNHFLNANNSTANNSYNFRTTNDFTIPFSRTHLRVKCIKVFGPTQWNNLPNEVRNAESLAIFKTSFSNFILNKY